MKSAKRKRSRRLWLAGVLSLVLGLTGWLLVSNPVVGQPQAERFDQVWQTINENFFDPNFNGVNWAEMRQQYKPQVLRTSSQAAEAALINQMLGELKTSHTRYYIPSEPAYYQILGIFAPLSPEFREEVRRFFPDGKLQYSGIGIFTKEIAGETFVSAVLDGSSAAQAGLRVGDRILSANGQPFQPIASFTNQAGEAVQLQIQRSPDPSSQQTLSVTPQRLDGETMFLDAMKASMKVVRQGGKKIAYVHIWSYAGDQYQELLEQELIYGRLRDADALVLDLREGWGGAPLTVLNFYGAKGPRVTNVVRDGSRYSYVSHWNKPVVMLVNEGSRSAKEILAYSFQTYDIGTVVGTQTAGAVVAGRPFLMQDGSVLYVAVADVYLDGDRRLEGVGVTPDIVVPFSPQYANGADPQKERAIQVAVEAANREGA